MTKESLYVTRTETFAIEDPVVYVESISGKVLILESPDGQCHIEILADSEDSKRIADLTEITARDNHISVRIRWEKNGLRNLFNKRTGDLNVVMKLPKTSALEVRTVSADVEITNTILSAEIKSVSGEITVLQNPTSNCSLKTVSGDITTHTFSECSYTLKSISGDVTVHVATGLEVDVDGKSLSGDTKSEIPLSSSSDSSVESSETVTINASTVSGDIQLVRN
jgi:DUF4097 and DUF4098 domain-containing protein YvlB